MKNNFSFLLLVSFYILFSQKLERDSQTIIVSLKSTFQKNIYNKKYLLIGDFLPVCENSKIKLAKVYTEEGFGYINEKGEEIIPPIYNISDFKNGLAYIQYQQPSSRIKTQTETCFGIFNYKRNYITRNKCYNNLQNILPLNFYYESLSKKNRYVTDNNDLVGIVNADNKKKIPENYISFSSGEKYIIGTYKPSEKGQKGIYDIYNLDGVFLKRGTYYSLETFNNSIIGKDEKGYFFIDPKTFLPKNNIRFDEFSYVPESEKAIFKVYVYKDKKIRSKYLESANNYLINDKYEVINPNFPNAEVYKDKFLIQYVYNTPDYTFPIHVNIINFKGEKITDYDMEDYELILNFCPDKIDKKEFLEKNKENWKKYTFSDKSLTPESFFDFRNLHIANKKGKYIKTGIVDIRTSEIKFIVDSNDWFKIYGLIDRKHFILQKDKKCAITDEVGKILMKYNCDYIYNLSNELLAIKYDDNNYNIINLKNLELISKENYQLLEYDHFYKNTAILKSGEKFCVLDVLHNKNLVTNYKFINPYYLNNQNFVLFNENELEVFDKITSQSIFKLKFKKNYLQPNEPGYYKDGFYISPNGDFTIDKYGNSVDFNIFDFQH